MGGPAPSLLPELLDRSYRPADKPTLLEIEGSAGEAAWNKEQLAAYLREPCTTFRVIAHRARGEEPIGFCGVQNTSESLYVANISVAPDWRRRGVASFAMTGVENLASDLGLGIITLDVQERNLGAQLLYRACGFVAVEIRRGSYGNQDGYRMRKTLDLNSSAP